MGHNICAIVGKCPIDEDKVKYYHLAVAYEENFAIVILEMDSIFYWSEKLNKSFESESENIDWACELVFFFANELGMETYAIIQTNYFAGIGDQYASLYKNGKPITSETSINDALQELGVVKGDSDEFDTINLGKYRQSELYYWDTHNQAEGKPNMIAGKIPKDNS